MTQIATVLSVPCPGQAEVVVARQSACAHDCENCSGCGAKPGSVTVTARTDIPVRPGDRVEIYSDNKILAIAALVYLVPLVLFLAGCLIPASLSEGLRYACGGLGFVLGLVMCVLYDRRVRRRKTVTYRIERKL